MNRSYKFILVIIFALAIYLRIDAYLINNSFFTDEILLAQNIFERNYLGLFLPLNYFQSAPYLFLALSKFVSNFGINELCFRFIPFLSSLISVYLFYLLSKEIFQTRLARAAALFTFGISYQLLFYAQVFKQYSSLLISHFPSCRFSTTYLPIRGVIFPKQFRVIIFTFSFL